MEKSSITVTIFIQILFIYLLDRYSSYNQQQHPPFIDHYMKIYTNFIFQIILIDPLLENPPGIA